MQGPLLVLLVACSTLAAATCAPGRPPVSQRKFQSPSVEAVIANVASQIVDKDIACIFANALPNTLDTTIYAHTPIDGHNDTFVLTGDIEAMWLRDSMNQILPYMDFTSGDAGLRELLQGVVHRQTMQINTDVYANAHNYAASQGNTPHANDQTSKPAFLGTRTAAMTPMIFERKYELDSLCAFLKLSRVYHQATNDSTPFTPAWVDAIWAVLDAMADMQTPTASYSGTYTFQRCDSCEPMDTLIHGLGWPGAATGMVRSAFRPSDDATVYPFNIPANAMAVVELNHIAALLATLGQQSAAATAVELAKEIEEGIERYGVAVHPTKGEVYAYEVDGFGNQLFMDDANSPSLLGLPYLGYRPATDPRYKNTRSMVLDASTNPYFFAGTAGNGTGGPHNGLGWVWPMGIIMRAMTSTDDAEITMCLNMLRDTAANTGFMHESFWKDNAGQYTRPWFAWANSFFGELILTLTKKRPHLLFQ
eukprot:m.38692 g.38692  ORF g.38692 m.38692 type:complete len:478 (-) comp5521_c0_seq1:62-1495(-)